MTAEGEHIDLGPSSVRTGSHCLARFVLLLQEPARLATEVLEEWCGAPVTAEIRHRAGGRFPIPLAERTPGRGSAEAEGDTFLPPERVAELMQISTGTSVQFRTVHLRAGTAKVATASAVVALDRISTEERTVLSTTNTPLGLALASGGVQRVMVTSPDLTRVEPAARTPGDADAPVLTVTALLCRGTVPVGLVRETFLQRLLD
jgi:chorismate-pyruvate lyase